MKLYSSCFGLGERIPELNAYGRCGEEGKTRPSANLNPHLAWSDVPAGTKSFALCCLDDDVPTDLTARTLEGELPAWQPRRRFVHWVQVDIPESVTEIPQGALSNDKKCVSGFGRPGLNDYTRGAVVPLGETGSGYDGPCPPAVDGRWHTYRFLVFALDRGNLDVPTLFTWQDLEKAIDGHVLACAEWSGRYSLNPRLQDD